MDFSKPTKSPIVLKAENKQYACDPSKEMRGYLKLEKDDGKGLIVIIADNLKFFPRCEYIYTLIFAGTRNEKRCYHMVGNLAVGEDGKAEGSFRINTEDIDGSGARLEDFSTAIVATMSSVNAREALHPVLKGSFPVCKEHLGKSAGAETGSTSGDRTGDRAGGHTGATPKDYSPFYNKFILGNCIEIAKQQDCFEDILPFKNDPTKARWKKITDLKAFPIIAPGALPAIQKYSHFLFGWHDSHYFLGVPGRFFPHEQPDEGKSGFVFWQPIVGMEAESHDTSIPIEERRKNIYGYWIASINRYNGHIEEIPLIDK